MINFIRLILIVALSCYGASAWAQVGIGIADPNPAAVLDITADTTGVLFPRISNSAVLDTATGLFFYATADNKFYYFNGTEWQCVNPFSSASKDIIEGGIKIQNGDVTIQGGDLYVEHENTLNGYGTTPLGGIIMWSGDPSNLPEGWKLCDGVGTYTDHTGISRNIPNLKGRFIVSYDSGNPDYNGIGKSGGEPSHKLTANESGVKAHNHIVSGYTNIDGIHRHWARGTRQVDYQTGGDHLAKANWDPPELPEDLEGGAGPVTRTDGAHKHQINITSQNSGPTDATDAHENRPPYYVLAYIIRVK